jgi:hypothetical protein
MPQSISKVEGNLLTKSESVEALWLWDACSETKHQKDKIFLKISKPGTPTAKSICLTPHCQKHPKLTDFATKIIQSVSIFFSVTCNAFIEEEKNNLLHEQNRNIETPDIFFNSALSVSTQSWCFDDKCLWGGQTLQKTNYFHDLRRKRTPTAKCLFLTMHIAQSPKLQSFTVFLV